MEYITVYEYVNESNSLLHLISLLILTIFGFTAAFSIKRLIKTYSFFRQFIIFFCYLVGGISLIMLTVMLFNIPNIKRNESELRKIIETRSFHVVEGKIEDFSHSNRGGQIFESFRVQGIKFEYSDFITNEGFHQTSKNGGPIIKNGQQVKISYYVKNNENLILKLEIKDTTLTGN